MRVLVAGGAGFIGSHLCDALVARGSEVWCIDNLHLGRRENVAHLEDSGLFHFENMDILDEGRLHALFAGVRFSTVFHLAANSDIERGVRDPELDLRMNFLTTVRILNAMHAHGVERLFFASTSAVFGETRDRLHEDYGPLKPISMYGASKLAAEAYISAFTHSFGLKTWVLRFPNVVGDRSTHGAVHDFIRRLRLKPEALDVLGDGNQTKPYLYVADVVSAILLVHDKAEGPMAVYHVGNETCTSVREIAAIVIEEMGLKNAAVRFAGGDRGWVGDVPFFTYDISKIKSLGWKPSLNSTDSVRLAVQRILKKQQDVT